MRVTALTGFVVLTIAGCDRARPPDARDADRLLRSSDRIAVYDAGVAAYRAKDYALARRFWRQAMTGGNAEAHRHVAQAILV